MYVDSTFRGRVALVVGGTSGIGSSIAKRLAGLEATVILAGRREDEGRALVAEIRNAGGAASYCHVDVRNESSVRSLHAWIETEYGRLDIAFNNAGVAGPVKPLCEVTEEEWDDVVSTNLKGMWLCMKHQAPLLKKSGGGSITNTASVFGLVGSKFSIGPYAASKHGIVGLTRVAAAELATSNIRVNVLAPGITNTPMTESARRDSSREFQESIAQLTLLGRAANPEEIAEAAVWLASSAASYLTGSCLTADGGWSSI